MDDILPDISKLPPKEQVAAHLLTENPEASNRQIGRLLVGLGLYKNEQTGALLLQPGTELNKIKQALQEYAHVEIVAPSYKIHSDELIKIADKQEKGSELSGKDLQAVYKGEKLAGETINIHIEETIKVGVIHGLLSDLMPTPEDGPLDVEYTSKDGE
jgi:hypothetical protein